MSRLLLCTSALALAAASACAAEPPLTPPPAAASAQDAAAPPPPAGGRAGVRVARVAGAPVVDGRLRGSAGWDSNALLDSDPDRASAATAVHSGEAAIGWRPVADERDYLKLTLTAAYDRRPQLVGLDTAKLALAAAAARQGGVLTGGGSLTAARYLLDGDGAVVELRGGGSLGRLRADSADLFSAEVALLHFDRAGDRPQGADSLFRAGEADARSGLLGALGWRHWWLPGSGGRIEAGLRAGGYAAEGDAESYLLLQPFAALRWRPEGWEVQGRAAVEGRSYAEGRTPGGTAEESATAILTASADRRLATGLWGGAYLGASARGSSLDDRDYRRWQAGLRLTWTLSAED